MIGSISEPDGTPESVHLIAATHEVRYRQQQKQAAAGNYYDQASHIILPLQSGRLEPADV